ncbi:hemin uptake protein HemP [Thauera sp.]|jgi:hemin uptake protein HemP|uniref:hemin uptake protein HemP n=1 Tax=Thauera sp. TaxID=1905334 RepID=UPI002A36E47C|nr:hemin uptake protein HemP [Thauera sp.]MDX9885451.1 hemin uptake protein HemP [Thauera sp.]
MIEIEPSHDVRPAPARTIGASDSDRDRVPTPALTSDQLLGGLRAVTIEHEGTHYVLRATRNGKLILTK